MSNSLMSSRSQSAEPNLNISPSREQSAAIKEIVAWYGQKGRQEFYLAGYAGVGKSTIVAIAIEEIKQKYKIDEVRTAAYTGKAASVLRRKGVEDVQTIHSLIYNPRVDKKTQEVQFRLSGQSEAAKADLIVLDECSMVDKKMAADLRSFEKKILVMGDPGQLPPIMGEGAFTSREPDIFLHEVHRQVADSPILELAQLAREGRRLPANFHRGHVRVLPLTKETQPLVYRPETQVICGLNRVRWVYTQRIRMLRGYEGEKPQTGERLVCCRNNHGEGLVNGATGTLRELIADYKASHGAYRIDVQMDDLDSPSIGIEIDPYPFNCHFNNGSTARLAVPKIRFNEFDWGYVLTCHKAQGSSWENVTIVDDSRAFRENARQWLYTAITRAETMLTILTR